MDTDVQIPPKAASLGPLVGSFCFLGQVSGLGLRFETRVKGSNFRVCYVIIWGQLGHQRFGVRLFEVCFCPRPMAGGLVHRGATDSGLSQLLGQVSVGSGGGLGNFHGV